MGITAYPLTGEFLGRYESSLGGYESSLGGYPLTGEFVCPDALHERHCVGVQLVGLVDDGEWHPEPQPLEVAHLLGESDGLGCKVHLQPENGGVTSASLAADVEDTPLHYLLTRLNLQGERVVW